MITDEGKKGIFDRKDIRVNHIKTKIDYSNIKGKDVNFNNPKEKTASETERTISGLTEDMLEVIFDEKGEKTSLELVEDYLEKLVDTKESFESSSTVISNKRRRLSSHSSDESVLRYYRKKSKKDHKDLSAEMRSVKKYRCNSRSSSLCSKTNNFQHSERIFRKQKRSSHSSSSETDYNFDTKSKKSYKCLCRKCVRKEKYNRPSTSYSRCSKSSKYDYRRMKTQSDKNLKYHKYNAAMYAVSVILEIIKKDFRSKKSDLRCDSDDDSTDNEDPEMKYHRYNAAMYAVSVILEIIKHN